MENISYHKWATTIVMNCLCIYIYMYIYLFIFYTHTHGGHETCEGFTELSIKSGSL